MTITSVRLIFAGGGTGGHLYPAIAIADRIRELLIDRMPVEIMFVGTRHGLEYRMRDKLGYPLHLLNIRGLARYLSVRNLLLPFLIVGAVFKTAGLLRRFAPDVVVGTGGYVSWPVLKIAEVKNIPPSFRNRTPSRESPPARQPVVRKESTWASSRPATT